MLYKVKDVVKQIRTGLPYLIMMGMCFSLGLMFQMNAIKLEIVPYVIALKRTSVMMTAFFGFVVFKEKGFKERSIGVIIMLLGVFIISFLK